MKLVWIVLLFVFGIITGCNDAIEATSSPNNATSSEQPIVSPKPARATDGLIVLYSFNKGLNDNVVNDTSGYLTPQDLFIRDTSLVTWMDGGLQINSPVEIVTGDAVNGTVTLPRQIKLAVRANDAVSWEAWIKTANLSQTGPAAIFSYSDYSSFKNILVGQDGGEYTVHFTTTLGGTDLATQTNAVTTSLTHLVVTWSSVADLRLYINGNLAASVPCSGFANGSWQDLPIRVGHEIDPNSPTIINNWLGEIYLIAMYDRVLTDEEILNNYWVGVQ